MFENLTDKFEKAFKVLKGQGQISEINVAETLKEVRRALLDADVNFKTAKEFTARVKEKALGRDVLTAVSPGQLLVKICHEELAELMGGDEIEIQYQGNPGVILMSGLQGSGKTTFSGKLANYLKTKKGKNPLLVACDVYRPAAIDQLHVLGEQIGVEVYSNKEEKNPVKIAEAAIVHARSKGFNVVIVDTAGRLAVDEQMMNEIQQVKNAIKPTETLFVVDSMTGQDAVNTAKAFNEKINFDGVILTKLDGDTRGGAALSIREVVNKPIKFVGSHLLRHLGNASRSESDCCGCDSDGRDDPAVWAGDGCREAANSGVELLVVETKALLQGLFRGCGELVQLGEGTRRSLGRGMAREDLGDPAPVQPGQEDLSGRRAVEVDQCSRTGSGPQRMRAVANRHNQGPVVAGDGQVRRLVGVQTEFLEDRLTEVAQLVLGRCPGTQVDQDGT